MIVLRVIVFLFVVCLAQFPVETVIPGANPITNFLPTTFPSTGFSPIGPFQPSTFPSTGFSPIGPFPPSTFPGTFPPDLFLGVPPAVTFPQTFRSRFNEYDYDYDRAQLIIVEGGSNGIASNAIGSNASSGLSGLLMIFFEIALLLSILQAFQMNNMTGNEAVAAGAVGAGAMMMMVPMMMMMTGGGMTGGGGPRGGDGGPPRGGGGGIIGKIP